MIDKIDLPDEKTNILPIRRSYFTQEFWDHWDELTDRERAAHILGWLSELELAIKRITDQLQRIEEQEESQ